MVDNRTIGIDSEVRGEITEYEKGKAELLQKGKGGEGEERDRGNKDVSNSSAIHKDCITHRGNTCSSKSS